MEEYKSRFEALNTTVLAINPASVTSHQNYCSKKGFSFSILADTDGKITAEFKSTKENGKGVQRTVYALDPDGLVIYSERGMGDNNEILKLIKENS